MTVSAMLSSGFAAAARVLPRLDLGGTTIRWKSLAQKVGVSLTPEVRGADLLNLAAKQPLGGFPKQGTSSVLDPHDWPAIREVLLRHTDSDWIILGFWEGHLGPELRTSYGELLAGPLQRRYALCEAHRSMERFPRALSEDWPHQPCLIWPKDRAWFLHADIDDFDAKVGGSEALIEELVACPSLEAIRVHYTTVL